MLEILIAIGALVIISLGVSLVILVSSYQKVLRELYQLREEHIKNRKVSRVEALFEEKIKQEIESAGEIARRQVSKAGEKIKTEMRAKAESALDGLKSKLAETAIEEKEAEEAAVAQEFDSARVEIEKYKIGKIAEINKKANAVISQVVKDTLGKLLDQKTQEELVLKALEDAKRQNLL